MRRARRYEVYVPLQYNDGRNVEFGKIIAVRTTLLERFTGLTMIPQLPLKLPESEGSWKEGKMMYVDRVLIFVVCVVDRKSTRLNSSHIQKSRMPSSA